MARQAVSYEYGSLLLHIGDEWANESDGDNEQPGVMTLNGATLVEGHLEDMFDGWISEVLHQGDRIRFVFCESDAVLVGFSTATWKSDKQVGSAAAGLA